MLYLNIVRIEISDFPPITPISNELVCVLHSAEWIDVWLRTDYTSPDDVLCEVSL